jgi:hypothetical protein
MVPTNKWDKQHLRNLGLTQRQIDKIFDTVLKEAAAIGASLHNVNPDKPFSFADYPATKARIEKLIKSLQNDMITAIVNGIRSEWTLANNKNNALCDFVFGDNKGRLSKALERKYYSNNSKALEAFIERKNAGLKLSDRVWNYTNRFKTEIEMGIDLGLRGGLPATEIARDLKQYLKYPNKLFRRVRDEHGQLHLSKAAKAFHPGAGVYRSSYKNALRLARTETNIAYRTSDYTRWQQLDFVVGIEIGLSNNHPVADICDELKGKYPKDFKFTGWHPQCRCHALSILKTEEEMAADNKRIMNGEEPLSDSVNTAKDVPEDFKKWVTDNSDRIAKAEKRGALPYFIKDNAQFIEAAKNVPVSAIHPTVKVEKTELYSLYDKRIIQTSYPEITSKVIEVENEIRENKQFETGVAFDRDGNIVLDKRGASCSVSFTDEECKAVKDCVFTHNHPRGWTAKENTLGRIGNSFSLEDILFSVSNNVAEIRAVTPTYTFAMKRPENGWGIDLPTLKKSYDSISNEVRKKMNSMINKATTQQEIQRAIERAESSHFHLLWKEFSKRHGIEYIKVKSVR